MGRRFFEGAALSVFEARAYAEYQYQILGQPGSGEHCLNLLMEPIGYPRAPIARALEDLDCPVTWIYGVDDWMSPVNGRQCAERRVAAGKRAECVLLDGAGHYCFMNNDRGFDAAVLRVMAATYGGAAAPASPPAEKAADPPAAAAVPSWLVAAGGAGAR